MAVPVFFALATILLYANVLKAPFVLDDFGFLNDPHLLLTEITPGNIADVTRITMENISPRILPSLTFAFNYRLGRRDVTGYHLFNLLIHAVTAWLVFLVCRRTLVRCRNSSLVIPVMAGLLWLVNPLHVQSVTYIWQRMNSMAALFFILSLYGYIRARETALSARGSRSAGIVLFAFSLIAGLLALASKQNAATLPVMLALYEWFFFQDLSVDWLKKKLPWACLAVLVAAGLALFFLDASPVQAILRSYADKPFTMGQRLLTEPRVILYYITLLLFPYPSRLSLDYDFPLSSSLISPAVTLLAGIALAALFAGAVITARRHRLLSFAVIWFLANLVIESSVIGLELMWGYRTYLPSIFPFMALTAFVFHIVKSRPAAVCLLVAAIILSGFWTRQRNRVWQDELTLWQDAAAKSPHSARPYHNLGRAYQAGGDDRKAVAAYRQALSIRLDTVGPDHYRTGETWNDLGVAYDRLGDVENAADSYRRALNILSRRLGPAHLMTSGVYNNLCVLYGRNGDFDQAVYWCRKALTARTAAVGSNHPEVADLHNNLGLALAGAGFIDQARDHLETALNIYRRHLGEQHPRTGQCRENLYNLSNSIKITP